MTNPQAERRANDDLIATVFVYGAALVALLAVLPVLIVAAPLYYWIEYRAWRRWPIALVGAALVGLVVALGGAEAYANTLGSVWGHFRHDEAFRNAELWGLAPLALAAGVLAAPVLQVVKHHRNEEVETRHRREVSVGRRSRMRARRLSAKLAFPEPVGRTVLGLPVSGDVPGFVSRAGARRYVAPLVDEWQRQALILGETGSGKTVTALALASEAARCGWPVYWIDGKADGEARQRFLRAMGGAGRIAIDGSESPLDGWRGGPEAVVNRLLATQPFTEPYYEGIARSVLCLAVGDDPPRSFPELLSRIDKRWLLKRYRDEDTRDEIKAIPARELFGVRERYKGVRWAVAQHLDGDWSYDDVQAAYVPVGRPENRNQAAEVGAFILEDLLHFSMARKPPGQEALVVVDEFSKLSARPDAAVDLVERARSFGVALVLVGQTWASLGPDEAVRSRLAGTVGTVIVHQLKQPHDVAALAGTEWVMERTEQVMLQDHTGLGSQRAGNRYVVHPDEVRRLDRGEAFVINGGCGLKMRVRPVRER